jgi:hypothetical protein
MRPTRLVLAVVLALVGAVWVGQGIGVIPGSVMTGDPFWAVVGAVLLMGAALLVVLEGRRRPR